MELSDTLVGSGGTLRSLSANAQAAGFVSGHALPVWVRGEVIGTINLFHAEDRRRDAGDVCWGRRSPTSPAR